MKSTLNVQLFAGVIALFSLTSQAHAENFVGIGIGVATEYPGSDEYEALPNAAFEYETPVGILKNNQIGVQLDIVKNTSLDTGPIVRLNFGRDNDVTDQVVAALPEVATSAELGWFINSGFKLSNLGIPSEAIVIGQLNAVSDVGDGHGGTTINGSIGLVLQLTDSFRLVPSVGFNFVDDNYADSFYSVSSGGAALSGLDEFIAEGGLEFTQVALFAVRTINDRWTLTGTVAFNQLQDDAALSPITLRGTDEQFFTGFVARYAF